jgi:hypothetical protein
VTKLARALAAFILSAMLAFALYRILDSSNGWWGGYSLTIALFTCSILAHFLHFAVERFAPRSDWEEL